jgi:CheY-like chemotaxis protein
MSNKDRTLLIVDDSPIDLQMTMQALKGKYKVVAATSGEMAIQMSEKTRPDLILMDVNMPGMDGYQTCQAMSESNEHAQIIFISANSSTEEILKGYEVGGADYITKPFSTEVLINKIQTLIVAQEEKEALFDEAKMASETAMSVMASSGDLGAVLEFIRKSFTLTDFDKLGLLVIDLLKNYHLSGCMMLKIGEKDYYFSNSGEVSPLEKELLQRVTMIKERFLESGKRFFIHYERVNILVKNLPIDNLDLSGRIKDSLAIAIEAANERAAYIQNQEEISVKHNEVVANLNSTSHQSLETIRVLQKQIEEENQSILDDLQQDLEDAFLGLGLTEEQERLIMSFVIEANTKSSKVFEKSVLLESEMDKVISMISTL